MNFIKLTHKDRDGILSKCMINASYLTSAVWVDDQELTALNMKDQPTIWVTESPAYVLTIIKES